MRNGPAPILDFYEVGVLFDVIEEVSPEPAADSMIFNLSFRAGLRVSEIAHLTLDAFFDPRGRLTEDIHVTITKWRDERFVFKHPAVQDALDRHMWTYPDAPWLAVSPQHGGQMSPAALAMHMKRRLEEFGFVGCTSHSGRATFITELAQRHNEFGCSLWDVMKIAEHKHLSSTAKYLRRSEHGRELVEALGGRPTSNSFNNRGRENNGFKRNNRHQSPATILRHRQHEAWVAEQFLRSKVQSQWGAERGRSAAWRG